MGRKLSACKICVSLGSEEKDFSVVWMTKRWKNWEIEGSVLSLLDNKENIIFVLTWEKLNKHI